MNNNRRVNNGIILISVVSVLALIYLVCQFVIIYPRYYHLVPYSFTMRVYNPFNLGYLNKYGILEFMNLLITVVSLIVPISLIGSTIYYYLKKDIRILYIPIFIQVSLILLEVIRMLYLINLFGFDLLTLIRFIFSVLLQILIYSLLMIGLIKSKQIKGKLFVYLAIIPGVFIYILYLIFSYFFKRNFAYINMSYFVEFAALIGSYIMIVYFVEYDIRMSNLSTSPVTNTFTPSYNMHTEQRPTQRATNSLEHIQILKELASLKDQGIITNEEFESKKRDLLDKI